MPGRDEPPLLTGLSEVSAETGRYQPISTAVLCHLQAAMLLEARERGETDCVCSADLGISKAVAALSSAGATFPDGTGATWSALERIAADVKGCFEVCGNEIGRIQQMSRRSGRLASLYPTMGPPALLLSGTLMHRVRGIDPAEDTRRKLAPLGHLEGARLLDAATGLGYTAIEAADRGARVVTVEWDPAVDIIAGRNPWSAKLFDTAAIERRSGDVGEEIAAFDDGAFDAVLHDPPVIELAGDLYGGEFYRQLHRVLRRGGRLFHYIGNPDSPSGARALRGVRRRLGEVGFDDVRRQPEAFGVSARA